MTGLKRTVAIIAIILSVLVAFISVGAIAGTWIANGFMTRGALKVLVGVEQGLSVTRDGLNRVDNRLEDARAKLNTIEETVTQAGDDLIETNLALELIEKTVGEDLLPRVDSVRETIDRILDGIVAFNGALEAANEIPFVTVPTLTDELEVAADRATEVRVSVDEIRTSVSDAKAENVDQVVTAITSRTSKADDGLEELQQIGADYDAKISEIESDVASLKSSISFWLDVVAIVLTLWFLWVAVSQIAVIAPSWSVIRTGHLPVLASPESETANGHLSQPSDRDAEAEPSSDSESGI